MTNTKEYTQGKGYWKWAYTHKKHRLSLIAMIVVGLFFIFSPFYYYSGFQDAVDSFSSPWIFWVMWIFFLLWIPLHHLRVYLSYRDARKIEDKTTNR